MNLIYSYYKICVLYIYIYLYIYIDTNKKLLKYTDIGIEIYMRNIKILKYKDTLMKMSYLM